MAARKVARKSSEPKKSTAKKSAPKKQAPPKAVEVKLQLTIWVDAAAGDERSYEEFSNDLKSALKDKAGTVRAEHVLVTGGYYLVDGKVCLPGDYDESKRGFLPGRFPPVWAGGPDEHDILLRIEREKNQAEITRNPPHLRTARETSDLHKQEEKGKPKERRPRTPAEAIMDLHENTEWGKRKKAEIEESNRREREVAAATDDEDEDDFEWEDEEEEAEEEEIEEEDDDEDDDEEADEEDEEDGFEWDDDDAFDEDVADAAIEEQTSSALSRLKNTGPKKTVARRSVKRRK